MGLLYQYAKVLLPFQEPFFFIFLNRNFTFYFHMMYAFIKLFGMYLFETVIGNCISI